MSDKPRIIRTHLGGREVPGFVFPDGDIKEISAGALSDDPARVCDMLERWMQAWERHDNADKENPADRAPRATINRIGL